MISTGDDGNTGCDNETKDESECDITSEDDKSVGELFSGLTYAELQDNSKFLATQLMYRFGNAISRHELWLETVLQKLHDNKTIIIY